MSESLIFASTNPQYDNRLFIELPVQYMKIPSSEHGENIGRTWVEHVVYKNCSECQKQFLYAVLPRFVLGIFLYWTCNSMNNLLSYCGLVDAKIRASDKDLPVSSVELNTFPVKSHSSANHCCHILTVFVLLTHYWET